MTEREVIRVELLLLASLAVLSAALVSWGLFDYEYGYARTLYRIVRGLPTPYDEGWVPRQRRRRRN